MKKIAVNATTVSTTLTMKEGKLFMKRIELDQYMIKCCKKICVNCGEPIKKDFFSYSCKHEFCINCFKKNESFLNCQYGCIQSANKPFINISFHQKIKSIAFIEKETDKKYYNCLFCKLTLPQEIVYIDNLISDVELQQYFICNICFENLLCKFAYLCSFCGLDFKSDANRNQHFLKKCKDKAIALNERKELQKQICEANGAFFVFFSIIFSKISNEQLYFSHTIFFAFFSFCILFILFNSLKINDCSMRPNRANLSLHEFSISISFFF
jgi:hypothetical protein